MNDFIKTLVLLSHDLEKHILIFILSAHVNPHPHLRLDTSEELSHIYIVGTLIAASRYLASGNLFLLFL